MSLTEQDDFAAGVGCLQGRWGMQQGGCDEEPGRGVWERHLDRGLGLGMWDILGCGGRQC